MSTSLPPPTVAATSERAGRLDALRGVAIVWMVGFHFCYDLNHFGLWDPVQHFTRDPFWTAQRTGIVTLFLLCAGAGQGLALQAGVSWPRFWQRWRQVAGCALLVSAGSALMFPRAWIHFGVLHGVALMLLLVRAGVPWLLLLPPVAPSASASRRADMQPIVLLLALAGVALTLPWVASHPLFNPIWANWTGLVTRLPRTVDYVPLFPWLGVVLTGVALSWARWLHPWWRRPLPAPLQGLAWLGRHSLSIYMLHQPLLMGLVWLWTQRR
jgi:uncharacterized membrane protein